jgi:hypothetical protein
VSRTLRSLFIWSSGVSGAKMTVGEINKVTCRVGEDLGGNDACVEHQMRGARAMRSGGQIRDEGVKATVKGDGRPRRKL